MSIAISYSQLRQNLKTMIDQVCDDRIPVFIKRRNGGNAVLLSQDDYESIDETLYLTSSPRNKKRLDQGIRRINKGKVKKFKNIKKLKNELGV